MMSVYACVITTHFGNVVRRGKAGPSMKIELSREQEGLHEIVCGSLSRMPFHTNSARGSAEDLCKVGQFVALVALFLR